MDDALNELLLELDCDCPSIKKARIQSEEKKKQLEELLRSTSASDTSIVVFGSLARDEWTAGSDLDWDLLVDGIADPRHLEQAQVIEANLADGGFIEPGPTGTFGKLAFSHDILHRIGGQEDTNQNITHRILLLLESWVTGDASAHKRVLRQILNRYVSEDLGYQRNEPKKIPRFLLNDIVRYWRTMAVDFAYKKRQRAGEGWALRNAKLRMSRKLIFVSGLAACFMNSRESLERRMGPSPTVDQMVTQLERTLEATPLEILARATTVFEIPSSTQKQLFEAYEEFLTLLNDEGTRGHLKQLSEEDADSDSQFQSVRDIGHRFQEALTDMFFGETLREYTERYGVF